MLYGINVNPENGDIYVADAIDYTQSGAIYRYSTEGILIDQFKVGVIPNGMVFK
jgi:DNA-binding beta-propeller fold protein YncE